MFRRTCLNCRVSPFSLYLKDLSRQGKLSGLTNTTKVASKSYRKLSTAARRALQKRAERLSYPALDAYNRFQKEYAHRFSYLSNKERQRRVAALWTQLKERGTVGIPKVLRGSRKTKAKAKPKPAKAQVKKAARKVKSSRK